ncbi:MAG: glutaminyl-peptide cyclotransferase [Fibrobacterales bacterium]
MIKRYTTLPLIIGFILQCFTTLLAGDWKIVNKFPHDPQAFTQGLLYESGKLYESTGLYGASDVRMVSLADGGVIKKVKNEANLFAEGLCKIGKYLYQLSWKERTIITYSLKLDVVEVREYPITEGWGCTTNGTELITSDGSNTLYYLNPQTLIRVKSIAVLDGFTPITRINELEFSHGLIYANIWQRNEIIVIDPLTGRVQKKYDMSSLVADATTIARAQGQPIDVLNGIAYNPQSDTYYITGKLWPIIYEVSFEK